MNNFTVFMTLYAGSLMFLMTKAGAGNHLMQVIIVSAVLAGIAMSVGAVLMWVMQRFLGAMGDVVLWGTMAIGVVIAFGFQKQIWQFVPMI